MEQKDEFGGAEVIVFSSAVAFGDWLADNYKRGAGIWIKMAKKSSGIPPITSDEAVDAGLCWGWISGQRRSYDETYYLQKYVPRRPHSIWSQVNVEKVRVLTAAGRMEAPGIAEIDAAKADGRWDAAYVSQRNAVPPQDLLDALAQNEVARKNFEQLNKTDRYMVILQLEKKRTAASRATQIEKLVAVLAVHHMK